MPELAIVNAIVSQAPCTDAYFFCTCLVDLFIPEAGLDAVTLLEDAGVRVHFPEAQTCCGQPAHSSGQIDDARAVARQQLDLFPEPWPIVIPSGSCTGMIRHHWDELFVGTNDADKAKAVAMRVYELSEFLTDVLKVQLTDTGAATDVVLHTSCAARRQTGAFASTRTLLSQLNQVHLKIQEHESECCGFGGMFSVNEPEISGGIVRDKLASIQACNPNTLITGDCGCMLNITGHAKKVGRPVASQHLSSFLLERLGGVPAEKDGK